MTRLVDARGLRCPWPALRTAAAMRESRDLTVLTDDPAAPRELEALAEARGWVFWSEKAMVLRLVLPGDNESLSQIA